MGHVSEKLEAFEFANLLWEESRRSLTSDSFLIAPRDDMLLHQVGAGSVDDYLYGGFTVATGIRTLLKLVRQDSFLNLLDFGCGSGRVIRWLRDLVSNSNLHGVDINREAILWCTRNIRYAQFVISTPSPPLPYSDGHFDLILGVSVFSHLDEQLERVWLAELLRVSRPGAILLLTVHGKDKALRDLQGVERQQFITHGHVYQRAIARGSVEGLPDGSVAGLPDFYQVSYHSRDYVERMWSEYFTVIGFVEHGPFYYQDAVVLQKRDMTDQPRTNSSSWSLRLPIAMIEALAPGKKINSDTLEISGWAFWPDGRPLNISLWIDDQLVGLFPANKARPDVSEAFPTNPSAGLSGFCANVSIENLKRGPHMVWLSLSQNSFPICATFFTRDSLSLRVAKRFVRKLLSFRFS